MASLDCYSAILEESRLFQCETFGVKPLCLLQNSLLRVNFSWTDLSKQLMSKQVQPGQTARPVPIISPIILVLISS